MSVDGLEIVDFVEFIDSDAGCACVTQKASYIEEWATIQLQSDSKAAAKTEPSATLIQIQSPIMIDNPRAMHRR